MRTSPTISSASVGVTTQFYATGINDDSTFEDMTSFVSWSSSDSSIASIDASGLLTRHAVGSVTVTASYASTSTQVSSSVLGASLSEIQISPDSSSMPAGIRRNFQASGVYTDGSIEDLTDQVVWSSSDSAVATVDNGSSSKGYVEAIAAGSTTISASYGAVNAETELSVSASSIVALRSNQRVF